MKEYLSIGEFAKLSGLTIKALRYYDRIGVLKPEYVSSDTSYRYYTRKQITLSNLIMTSLELDLPLAYVKKEFISDDGVNYESFVSYAKKELKERIDDMKRNLDFVMDMEEQFDREKNESLDEYKTFRMKKVKCLLMPFFNDIDSFEYDNAIADLFNQYKKEEKDFEFVYGVMLYEKEKYIFVEISNPKFTKKNKKHILINLEEGDYEAKLTENIHKEKLPDDFYIIRESLLPGKKTIYEIIKKKEN